MTTPPARQSGAIEHAGTPTATHEPGSRPQNPSIEQLAVAGKMLAMQQKVIDLRAQIDRERLASEGFRRFGERVIAVDSLEAFFAIAVEEVVSTFDTETALLLRFGPQGPTVCATCCAEEASVAEVRALAGLVQDLQLKRAQVLSGDQLPPLQGRPTAVLLAGTYRDRSDAGATYAVLASVSRDKARFYPEFGPELAPLYDAFLHHIGALQQHLRGRVAALELVRATQHFVPQEFLSALGHADVTSARLGDAVQRRITILFADIRNFTAISERMTPAETAAFLNACLSRMGPHIRAHGGFVDKYIGDAIMALFPGSPEDAVQAAIAMQAEIAKTRLQFSANTALNESQWLHSVIVGIGIHTGDVMLCTVGEQERFEATVISDAVNLTARLETLTKQLGCTLLVSDEVAAEMSEDSLRHARKLGAFAVKGKSQSATVYEIFASDPVAVRSQKAASRLPFAKALEHYRRGELGEALNIVQGLVERTPADRPMAWWLAHMQQNSGSRATVQDHGVIRLDEK